MDKELEDVLDEAKATGEDSESADAVTPAGGNPKKRRADLMMKADQTADNIEKTVKTPQGSHDVGLKEEKMQGNYARVIYNYREDYYHITVYKNGKVAAEDDGYFGANEKGNPLIKKFTDVVRKAGLKPEGLPIVDEDGKKGVFKGNAFKWGIKESVFDLFEGEGLSEEFKTKTVAIVEAVVAEKVASIQEALEAEYETKLEESVAEISESIVAKLDSYLDFMVAEWVEKNEVAIESNIKVEVAESLLQGMTSLLSEHNMSVDEEQLDLAKIAEEKAEAQIEAYNDLFESYLELKAEKLALEKEVVFAEVSEDLSDLSADKLLKLSESISYENVDEYRTKLESLKESFLAEKVTRSQKDEQLEELVEETKPANPQVGVYLESFNKFKK